MEDLKFAYRFQIPDYLDPSETVSGELFFDPEKCTGCMLCTTICPARSVIMEKRKKGDKTVPRLDTIVPGVTGCVSCGCCVAACPSGAISIVRGFSAGKFYTRLHQAKELAFPKRY
ncbi:MAG: 4Fe-4S dicluster domain-containing protein [Thermodesulfobacteriota bacterium]